MVEESTQVLLGRARSGDRAAFERIADRCRPRLEALIRLRIGSDLGARVEVDDIVQETLLKGFTSIDTLRADDESAFFAWLTGIARNVMLHLARHHGRRPSVPYDEEKTTSDPSPSKGIRRSERFDRLQDSLDALSAEHREVILLARIEGLPAEEVARRMDRSQGAVAQLLWRALRKLRERFGDTQSLGLPDRRFEDRRKIDEH